MTLKYYYSLILSLLATLSVSSQQVVVTELPTQRLLPVAHIHRILQDSEGYMQQKAEACAVTTVIRLMSFVRT